MAKLFVEWNKGELDSYLIEITAKILAKKDDKTDGHVVDKILDKTGMKGTGECIVDMQGAGHEGLLLALLNRADRFSQTFSCCV